MREIGINTWVWASPLTDETVTDLLHHVADLGFDAVELPLETSGDLSPEVVGAVLQGVDVVRVVAAHGARARQPTPSQRRTRRTNAI
jgi:D-psicose/D-tagatose/L-ribulose 3-epimerase